LQLLKDPIDITGVQINGEDEYDVMVVGGGAAGIGAAVGASQANKLARILLIESESCLGGAGGHRGVNCYCGILACDGCRRKCVRGVWDQVHQRLVKC
jgi:heterodisulfide reductase subunit A-like polyferredoxin